MGYRQNDHVQPERYFRVHVRGDDFLGRFANGLSRIENERAGSYDSELPTPGMSGCYRTDHAKTLN
jgi:hypothetical protein